MRETALVLFGVGIVLSWLSMHFMLRMISRINDKLPSNQQLTIPFVRLSWKVLSRMYARMYPDGDLHLKISRLSRWAIAFHGVGIVLLIISLRRLDHRLP